MLARESETENTKPRTAMQADQQLSKPGEAWGCPIKTDSNVSSDQKYPTASRRSLVSAPNTNAVTKVRSFSIRSSQASKSSSRTKAEEPLTRRGRSPVRREKPAWNSATTDQSRYKRSTKEQRTYDLSVTMAATATAPDAHSAVLRDPATNRRKSKVLNELVGNLNFGSNGVSRDVAEMAALGLLERASTSDAGRDEVLTSGAVPRLLELLGECSDLACGRAAACVIRCLSAGSERQREQLKRFGVVKALVSAVELAPESVLLATFAATIRNLCSSSYSLKVAVVDGGAIPILVECLKGDCTSAATTEAAIAIGELASAGGQVLAAVELADVTPRLAELLCSSSEPTREAAESALSDLGIDGNAGKVKPLTNVFEVLRDSRSEVEALSAELDAINDARAADRVEIASLKSKLWDLEQCTGPLAGPGALAVAESAAAAELAEAAQAAAEDTAATLQIALDETRALLSAEREKLASTRTALEAASGECRDQAALIEQLECDIDDAMAVTACQITEATADLQSQLRNAKIEQAEQISMLADQLAAAKDAQEAIISWRNTVSSRPTDRFQGRHRPSNVSSVTDLSTTVPETALLSGPPLTTPAFGTSADRGLTEPMFSGKSDSCIVRGPPRVASVAVRRSPSKSVAVAEVRPKPNFAFGGSTSRGLEAQGKPVPVDPLVGGGTNKIETKHTVAKNAKLPKKRYHKVPGLGLVQRPPSPQIMTAANAAVWRTDAARRAAERIRAAGALRKSPAPIQTDSSRPTWDDSMSDLTVHRRNHTPKRNPKTANSPTGAKSPDAVERIGSATSEVKSTLAAPFDGIVTPPLNDASFASISGEPENTSAFEPSFELSRSSEPTQGTRTSTPRRPQPVRSREGSPGPKDTELAKWALEESK